jgi:hypothetical protein
MSIGNIHNNVQRAHRNGIVLLGFLAIPKSGFGYLKTTMSLFIFYHLQPAESMLMIRNSENSDVSYSTHPCQESSNP